ncbi:MAG: GntR family transcriptional regulator [Pseudomonadota bacterium]
MATTAESIHHELARRIVNRELSPGTVLDESSLAATFHVSRTPIREALRKLTAIGLVDHTAHRKAKVAQPSDKALAGMFFVMSKLEVMCAGESAVHMTAAQRRGLEGQHAAMSTLVRRGEGDAFALANEEFHNLIYAGTANAYLNDITLATRTRLQAFRRAQFATLGRLTASHAEHDLVVQAILQGDKAAAERAMHAHIGYVENSWNRLAERLYAADVTANEAV